MSMILSHMEKPLYFNDDFVEEIWNLSLQSYSNKNFFKFFAFIL